MGYKGFLKRGDLLEVERQHMLDERLLDELIQTQGEGLTSHMN